MYTLSSFGERYRISTVWNETKRRRLRAASQEFIRRLLNTVTDPNSSPEYYRILDVDGSTGDPRIEFWPTPNATETINVYATVEQADLLAATDRLDIPFWPVVLKAYALAIAERGEHGGTTFQEAEAAAMEALTDAIAQQNLNEGQGWASDWRVE